MQPRYFHFSKVIFLGCKTYDLKSYIYFISDGF
jgi:hypothetical protein